MKNLVARTSELIPDRLFYRLLARQFRRQEPELRWLPVIVPPDRPAVDVGAWWGPWTYWLSARAPRVVAVEPQPRLAHFLRRVTAPNVTVLAEALSDHPGEVTLAVPGSQRGEDALAAVKPMNGSALVEGNDRIVVRARRLDDLDVAGVGFVKIDAEGHELRVLEGGRATLAAHQPVVFVEVEQRHHAEPIDTVFSFLQGLGYVGYFLLDGRWRTLAEFDVTRHQTAAVHDVKSAFYVSNFVFVPAGLTAVRERLAGSGVPPVS